MEPHATIPAWDGDFLTLYDATQYVSGVKETVTKILGLAPEKIRVICPYVGGGFGCKGSTWSHVVLAATRDGKLTAMQYDVIASTSFMEDWLETAALATRMLYACANQKTSHRLARLHTGNPTRADAKRREPFAAVIARNGGMAVEATMDAKLGKEKEKYAYHSFGAVFAEVHVDPDLGIIRVALVVASYGIGRLLN